MCVTFQEKVEIQIEALIAIIDKSEQNVGKLTSENLNLKSRLVEIEIKFSLRVNPAFQ